MNTDQYIGIPFKEHGRGFDGCDCWGLVRLVYQCELGIKLTDYSEKYDSCVQDKDIPVLISDEAAKWQRVENVEPLDVLLLIDRGRPGHIAVALDGRRMLHTTIGVDACIEDFTTGKWRDKLAGIYRHK